MNINRISTYILVCFLTSQIRNILVPVKGDDVLGSESRGSSEAFTEKEGATATTPAENVKKTAIELDIKKDAGTNEFGYKKDGNVVTFTAKDNYAFNAVKQGNKEIWKTEKEFEYATKVVLNGKGKKDKIVTIHMPNDTKKSYKKDKNNPWSEYTGPLPSNGKSGGSSATPTDNTNEKTTAVDIDKPWDTNYISDHDGLILTYKPRGDYSFNIVKKGSTEIWKTGHKKEYSNKVKADFGKNIVTVYIGTDGKSTKVYTKGSDGNWKEEGQDSTQKSSTDGSGGRGTQQSTPATQ
ncbi:hypothetical protein MACK_001166 [Theileria orientalis]|uniref:Uncharacterized protein n=1 Tax=Theileria orientalis TaxID=68886 RepID=A0A976MCC5_THEOR|nr:hypothetical protein MACK_001166 [Theileria orientalis]